MGRLLQAGGRGWLLAAIPLLIALALLLAGERQDAAAMTDTEQRLAATLERTTGAGAVRVMVLEEETAQAFAQEGAATRVKGVLIVAQGADDLGVRMRLQQAVMTLFSLEAGQVEVMSGSGGDV